MNLGDPLTRAINEAFQKAYPGELSPPTADEKILVKRVNMLLDDLLCTRINFSVTNKAYCEADRKLRDERRWWQFWRY